ncbi:unnamed protein product [Chrysoparadoxa australica]
MGWKKYTYFGAEPPTDPNKPSYKISPEPSVQGEDAASWAARREAMLDEANKQKGFFHKKRTYALLLLLLAVIAAGVVLGMKSMKKKGGSGGTSGGFPSDDPAEGISLRGSEGSGVEQPSEPDKKEEEEHSYCSDSSVMVYNASPDGEHLETASFGFGDELDEDSQCCSEHNCPYGVLQPMDCDGEIHYKVTCCIEKPTVKTLYSVCRGATHYSAGWAHALSLEGDICEALAVTVVAKCTGPVEDDEDVYEQWSKKDARKNENMYDRDNRSGGRDKLKEQKENTLVKDSDKNNDDAAGGHHGNDNGNHSGEHGSHGDHGEKHGEEHGEHGEHEHGEDHHSEHHHEHHSEHHHEHYTPGMERRHERRDHRSDMHQMDDRREDRRGEWRERIADRQEHREETKEAIGEMIRVDDRMRARQDRRDDRQENREDRRGGMRMSKSAGGRKNAMGSRDRPTILDRVEDRQEGRQQRRDDRQDGREERRDGRQERKEDRRDGMRMSKSAGERKNAMVSRDRPTILDRVEDRQEGRQERRDDRNDRRADRQERKEDRRGGMSMSKSAGGRKNEMGSRNRPTILDRVEDRQEGRQKRRDDRNDRRDDRQEGRQDRREGRQDGREGRRDGRQDGREGRREGRLERREERTPVFGGRMRSRGQTKSTYVQPHQGVTEREREGFMSCPEFIHHTQLYDELATVHQVLANWLLSTSITEGDGEHHNEHHHHHSEHHEDGGEHHSEHHSGHEKYEAGSRQRHKHPASTHSYQLKDEYDFGGRR